MRSGGLQAEALFKEQQEGLTQAMELHVVQKVLDKQGTFAETPWPSKSHSHTLPGLTGIWVHG